MKFYKDYNKDPCSFLVNDTTLPSDNPLRFRKNLLWKWVVVRKLKWQNRAKQSSNQFRLTNC